MSLLSTIFGCWHKRTTFPITRRVRGKRGGTYVVCLSCGREFAYDWQQMKIVGPIKDTKPASRIVSVIL